MIVVCEGCHKRFQLDDSRIPAKGARVRCKHCHHRFRVPPPGSASTGAGEGSAEAAARDASLDAASAPSADDTLFGEETSSALTGGAPIDGDRTLFGSMEDDEADAAPAPAESGGVTQDLSFVSTGGDVSASGSDAAAASGPEFEVDVPDDLFAEPAPEPAPEPESAPKAAQAAPEPAQPEPPPPAPRPEPREPKPAPLEPKPAPLEPKPALEPEAATAKAAKPAPAPEIPAAKAAKPASEPEATAAKTAKPAPAKAPPEPPPPASAPEPGPPEDLSVSGPAPELAEDLAPDAGDPAEALSSPDRSAASAAPDGAPAAVAEDSGEGSWEFAESSFSLDDGSEEEEPAAAAASEPAPEPAEPAGPAMELEPDAPSEADEASLVDDTPSLRAVESGQGATFEMVADAGAAPLELAGDDPPPAEDAPPAVDAPAEAAPEAPAAAPEPPPAEPAEPAPSAEIGSASDWDWIAADGNAGHVPEEVEPTVGDAPAPALDAAEVPDEGRSDAHAHAAADEAMPLEETSEAPGPADVQARSPWLQHAGWALSLVLLLAVAQGTVRIEPRFQEPPPGQVEIDGLMAENVRGHFVENARSGTLFVVSGELRNAGRASRVARELRVVLLDEHGLAFEGGGAPVGMRLDESLVRETPIGALQQQQSLQARSLAQQRLAPGEGVPFQAILAEVPETAVRFRLEAAGPERTDRPAAARAPEAG
jgi:predicted Zn finger-like uncharacterized protein